MRKTNLLFLAVITLLTLGMLNIPVTLSQPAPSTVYETGDYFLFSEERVNDEGFNRFFFMENATDGTDWRWESEGSNRHVAFSGNAEARMLRNRASISVPIDTVPLVRSEVISQPGSFEEYYHYVWDQNHDQSVDGGWMNNTDTRSLEGMSDEGGDEEFMHFQSNSSYALIFPEMQVNQFEVPFGDMGGLQSTFDGIVPLTSRTVTPEARTFTVNNANFNVNLRTVTSTFYVNHTDEFVDFFVRLGDEGDDSAPYLELNGTLNILIEFKYNHLFRDSDGLFMGMNSSVSISMMSEFAETNTELVYPFNPELNTTVNVDMSFSGDLGWDSSTEMVEASAFFGATRPSSSGTNALEEGDVLTYLLETENRGELYFFNQIGDPNNDGWKEDAELRVDYDQDGTLTIDVYRHIDNAFEAVIFGEFDRFADFYTRSDRTENGTVFPTEEDAFSSGPEPGHFFDIVPFFMSSPGEEITHFFEDNMWINDDIIRQFLVCEGPDCEGDDFWPSYDRQLLSDGPVNETSYYINLLEEIPDDPIYINGFQQYEFNVHEFTQNYVLDYTGLVDIRLDNDIWVQADITVEASGSHSFFYDEDTGALIVMEERVNANVFISFHGGVDYDFNPGTPDVQTDLDVSMYFEDRFFMMLNEHPNLYQTANEPPATDTPPDTPPDDGDNNDTDDAGLGLDLPLPIEAVVGGFAVMTIVVMVRRRNY